MDNETIYNEIGKLIKKERKKVGITQEQLAIKTNYSLSFIANIESNTYQSFSLHTLYNIANALNISIHDLIPSKDTWQEKSYQLICNNCKFHVDIPKEIGKYIENEFSEKERFTCPICKRKKVELKSEKKQC